MKRNLLCVIALLALIVGNVNCTHKPHITPVVPNGGYPDSIANIIVAKCTNAGCHNQASYMNAGELLLDTWEHMFQGGVSGAVTIPYCARFSPLVNYICPADSLGFVITDPGHLPAPLSRAEYLTVANWVASGCPDRNGTIPFAANADTRQKIYLTMQGCDLIGVIDAKSRLVMRYIPIGDAANQSPHDVEISGDGHYAYIPFFSGSIAQKIDVLADTVISSVNLGSVAFGGVGGAWSVIALSPLDTAMLVSGWVGNGSVVGVNTSSMHINPRMSVDAITGGTDLFPYPHGLAANSTFDTFYATLQNSVIKYAFDHTGVLAYHKSIAASGQPHQIEMAPDFSRYFVTCPDQDHANNDFVRVYDSRTDSQMAAIQVGHMPQEMDISPSKNYLFVACMADQDNQQIGRVGSVYVINMSTLAIVAKLYGDFSQPHDVTVDEQDGIVVVPSRNQGSAIPPHHATKCGGAGWYTVYNLNTLQPESSKRYEVTNDPYAIGTRFK